jgi:DNA-binding CsgD family transcriptional regulator
MTTSLSERELQILRLVAEGFSNRQIASQLDISENTVKVHVRNIFGKIQVASRTEASMYAVRNGLITDMVPVLVDDAPGVPDQIDTPPYPLVREGRRWLLVIGLIALAGVIGGGSWWWAMRDMYQTRPIAQPSDTQRWRQLAPLPTAVPGVQLVTVSGHLYALGGALGQTVLQYDASQDAWPATGVLPLQTPAPLSWSDASGVWLIDIATRQIWTWDSQTWQPHGMLPSDALPLALARVAGTLVVLDTAGTLWRSTDDAYRTWQATIVPATLLVQPRLVVVDDVLLLLGDGRMVWRSADAGRTWLLDGELTRPWQGGQAIPVLSVIMLIRDGQQSLYTLTVGEGGSQAVPVAIDADARLTIWQTMIVIGARDGSQIDTYQFIYQSFMPIMQ